MKSYVFPSKKHVSLQVKSIDFLQRKSTPFTKWLSPPRNIITNRIGTSGQVIESSDSI